MHRQTTHLSEKKTQRFQNNRYSGQHEVQTNANKRKSDHTHNKLAFNMCVINYNK